MCVRVCVRVCACVRAPGFGIRKCRSLTVCVGVRGEGEEIQCMRVCVFMLQSFSFTSMSWLKKVLLKRARMCECECNEKVQELCVSGRVWVCIYRIGVT